MSGLDHQPGWEDLSASRSNRRRIPSLDRVRSLPPVFDLRDVECLLGLERKMAIHYCWRWRQAGLVQPLGPRQVGVFYNLLLDPDGPSTRRAEALEKLLRLPLVVIGGSALHQHGWTTQRHHALEVAVPVVRGHTSVPQLHDINLAPRYVRWFSILRDGAEPGPDGLLVAKPEMALADALLAAHRGRPGDIWAPDADDIDLPDEAAREAVAAALARLGADEDEVAALLDDFRVIKWSSVRTL